MTGADGRVDDARFPPISPAKARTKSAPPRPASGGGSAVVDPSPRARPATAVFERKTQPKEATMRYQTIQQSILELRAELAGSLLSRKERRDALAELARLEAEAAKQLSLLDAEDAADC